MYFVFSDVHGCLNEMNELLECWNPKKETLVFLGDMVDRGTNSFGVIKRLMELKKQYGNQVIILKGNHDDEFIQWLRLEPDKRAYFYNNDLHNTIKSFYQGNIKKFQKDTRKQRAEYIKKNFSDVVFFINSLPLFYETTSSIFVHAGINLYDKDWKNNKEDMLWIRESFYNSPVISTKRVFFGHTPTRILNNHQNNDIWLSKANDKVGIDGACVYGGQLNGLIVDEQGEIRHILSVKKKPVLINAM